MTHPNARPPLPPQAYVAPHFKQHPYNTHTTAPAIPLGVPPRKPKPKTKQKSNKEPFHPYMREQNHRRPASPAAQWKAVLTDPLDDAMEKFKGELDIFPTSLAVPAWQDLLAHLALLKKEQDFDRKLCIPAVAERFNSLLEKVKSEFAVIQEDEWVKEETLTRELAKLVKMVEEYRDMEEALENPPLGMDINVICDMAKDLAARVAEQEWLVDMLDGAEAPDKTDMGEDPLADGTSFVQVPEEVQALEKTPKPSMKELWPESNYQDYKTRIAPLFPTATGKMLLTDLMVKMDEPVDSKIYLPRQLEMYTVEELEKTAPKGVTRWNNQYEDPLEPAKSWTWEEFSNIYNKPGFHFMIARVAQLSPQFKDPKLTTQRTKLAARWNCTVTLAKMNPRQDWMLCTVPSGSRGETDTLKYDLICLSEGNAVYVIRHFAPAGRARDLEWEVRGSLADDNSIYTQMCKRLLEFEMSDTRLGWWVMGVRKAGATSKFRGTFILDSPSVYWPWSMTWGHKHGSVPESSPLLNFEPGWSVRRPYACQCCYSTDHFSEECPLPFMKVGGTNLINYPARTLMLKKKATEWIISLEKSTWEIPIPRAHTQHKVPASPSVCPHPQRKTGPVPRNPLSAVPENEEHAMSDDEASAEDDAQDTRMSEAAPPHSTTLRSVW